MRRLSVITTALIATTVVSSTVEATEPRQVIIARVGESTSASLVHDRGDDVALLRVENAPADLAEILEKQSGEWCTRIERRTLIGNVQTFALYLVDSKVIPTVDLTARTRTLRLKFTTRRYPFPPRPVDALGRISGLGTSELTGVAIPPAPTRTPCGRGKNAVHCAHFGRAKKIADLLTDGRDLDVHERWAFRFLEEKPWRFEMPAYAYTSLVAARVLVARGLFPEAERMLTGRDVLRTETWAPYSALARADAQHGLGNGEESERILSALLSTVDDPAIRTHAMLAALRTSAEARRYVDAAARVEVLPEARTQNGDPTARAWLLAAEVALALGDSEAAYARLQNARREAKDKALLAAIHLRLGDASLGPAGSPALVSKHYRRASRGRGCTRERVALRRMVRRGTRGPDDELVRDLGLMSRRGGCFAVRTEAAYALAFVHSALGNDDEAIRTILALRDPQSRGLSEAWALEAAVDDALRQLIDKYITRTWRAADWARAVSLLEGPLSVHRAELSPQTMIMLSEAHRALDVDGGLADDLLTLVKKNEQPALQPELLLELAQAYLAAGDDFRGEVTLRFVMQTHGETEAAWRAHHLAARLELDRNDPESAATHLDAVEETTPGGDPRRTLQRLRIETSLALNQATVATQTFLDWVDGAPTTEVVGDALTVGVTSACLRDCSTELLERLLNRIGTFDGGALLTDRIRVRARERGITSLPEREGESKGGVWERYEQAIAASNDPQ